MHTLCERRQWGQEQVSTKQLTESKPQVGQGGSRSSALVSIWSGGRLGCHLGFALLLPAPHVLCMTFPLLFCFLTFT